jgi:hypothetical protein
VSDGIVRVSNQHKLLTKDEARRIAAGVDKPSELLLRKS